MYARAAVYSVVATGDRRQGRPACRAAGEKGGGVDMTTDA